MKLANKVRRFYEGNVKAADVVKYMIENPSEDILNPTTLKYIDVTFEKGDPEAYDMGDIDFNVQQFVEIVRSAAGDDNYPEDEAKKLANDVARQLSGKKFEYSGMTKVSIIDPKNDRTSDAEDDLVADVKIKKAKYNAQKDSMEVECEITHAKLV